MAEGRGITREGWNARWLIYVHVIRFSWHVGYICEANDVNQSPRSQRSFPLIVSGEVVATKQRPHHPQIFFRRHWPHESGMNIWTLED